MESYGTCGAETYGSSEQQPILQRYASANPDLLPRGRVLTDVSDPNHVAKVVRYKSTHLARWGVVDVRMIGSTLFSSVAVWVKLLLFSLVGAGVFCFAELLFDIKRVDVSALTALTNVLNGLVAFLLGLYIGKCLDKWWMVTYNNLGDLWEELTGLCMFVGTAFPWNTERDMGIRRRVLRCHLYCILANKLVIRSLRSTEEASHWDPALPHMDVEQLVHFRFDGELKHTEAEAPLLEWDELVTLRDGNCRPQIMAAWIQGFIAHLSHELRHDPKAGEELLQDWYPNLMDRSERIRRCIGNCERSLSTQLPFAYVHLIVFVVMLNNTVLSIVAGLFCAAALKNGAVFAVSAEVLYSITITLVYQSLLELCACLLNPFDQSGLAAIPTTYCSQKLQQNLVFCMENAATSLTRFAGEGLSGPSARAHWQDTGSVRVASTNTSNSQASSPGVPTAGHRKTYSSGTEGLL